MSISSRFQSPLPKDRIVDWWETEAGLAFVLRQRIESGLWLCGPEPTGLYHVVIHSANCQLSKMHNGRIRYRGCVPAGTIQFSRPDEEVRCIGDGSIKFLMVDFTPDFLATHLESLSVNPDIIELREVRSTTDIGLVHLARQYQAISSSSVPVTQLYFDTLRQAMIDRIVLRHATRPIKRSFSEVLVPAKARRVIDYVETNLASNLRLAELSAVAGISRSHFARAFRNTVGMAPHTFVLQRRLTRAIELVKRRTLSLREVADQCGFADQAHLTRAYKAAFGHPPSLHSLPRRLLSAAETSIGSANNQSYD
jgi:AraC family transcriptional regulator